jgi:hypothetical protein
LGSVCVVEDNAAGEGPFDGEEEREEAGVEE